MTRGFVLVLGSLTILVAIAVTFSPASAFASSEIANENQSVKTYENDEYGFAFQYPANWQTSIRGTATSFEKDVIAFESPEKRLTPSGDREVAESVFSVYATKVSSYLDPDDLQLKSNTAEDYARDEFSFMLEPSSYGMTFEFGKNETTSLGGKNDSWRIDHITSLDG